MSKLTKKPIQIYLEPGQDQALRYIAERRGTSIGALIRESVQTYLLKEIPVEEDPAMSIISLGRSGLGDLSIEHDRYLVEMEKECNR